MTLTHRRHEETLSDGWVILFCDSDNNSHYGDHIWTLKTELPYAGDNEELIAWAASYYNVDNDEALDLVNPSDIVDTAGAWDDPQFVSDLWQAMEAGEIKMAFGYRTYDGAVVIDHENVTLDYRQEPEEEW